MSRYNYRNNTAGTLDSTHIYYNINYTNPASGSEFENGNIVELPTNDKELVFNFNQNRAAAYLQRPDDYYLSVVRFTVESPNLPVFIAQPIQGSTNPNATIYTITLMDSNNIPYQSPVYWIPQDKTTKPPNTPIEFSSISPTNPYYYCYSYSYFTECINKTLDYLWTTNFSGRPGEGPYLYFDANTNLFTLGGPVGSFRTSSTGVPITGDTGIINIYFNGPLLNLLSSLPASYVAGKVTVATSYSNLQMDYLMILSTGSDVPSASPTQPYVSNIRLNSFSNQTDVYATQEYNTLPLWTPLTSIVFKTSLLTTNPEIRGTPVIYSDNNQNINAGLQNADILNVLSEHSVPLLTGTEYKPFIYYEPTGEYKLTDLYGRDPIYGIDISVFWRDSFGNLVPFKIGIGSSATIKILFRKKTFNADS
jgi:hypothetical protein